MDEPSIPGGAEIEVLNLPKNLTPSERREFLESNAVVALVHAPRRKRGLQGETLEDAARFAADLRDLGGVACYSDALRELASSIAADLEGLCALATPLCERLPRSTCLPVNGTAMLDLSATHVLGRLIAELQVVGAMSLAEQGATIARRVAVVVRWVECEGGRAGGPRTGEAMHREA